MRRAKICPPPQFFFTGTPMTACFLGAILFKKIEYRASILDNCGLDSTVWHEKISNFVDLRHRFQIVAVTVRPHVSGFVAFSKVSTLESVFKSLRLRCAFSPDTCGR